MLTLTSLLIFVVIVVLALWLLDQLPLGKYLLPIRVVIVVLALVYLLTRYLPGVR